MHDVDLLNDDSIIHNVSLIQSVVVKNGHSPYYDENTKTWWQYDDIYGNYVDTKYGIAGTDYNKLDNTPCYFKQPLNFKITTNGNNIIYSELNGEETTQIEYVGTLNNKPVFYIKSDFVEINELYGGVTCLSNNNFEEKTIDEESIHLYRYYQNYKEADSHSYILDGKIIVVNKLDAGLFNSGAIIATLIHDFSFVPGVYYIGEETGENVTELVNCTHLKKLDKLLLPEDIVYSSELDYIADELLGKADVYSKEQSDQKYQPKGEYLTEHQDISGKVDKVNGMGLSTNDYTNEDKLKVDGIPDNPKYTDTIYDDTEINNKIATIVSNLEKLENIVLEIKNILGDDNPDEYTVEAINELIVSYFETKTSSEVET